MGKNGLEMNVEVEFTAKITRINRPLGNVQCIFRLHAGHTLSRSDQNVCFNTFNGEEARVSFSLNSTVIAIFLAWKLIQNMFNN